MWYEVDRIMPNRTSGTALCVCIILGLVIVGFGSGGLFSADPVTGQKVATIGWGVIGLGIVILFVPDIASKIKFG